MKTKAQAKPYILLPDSITHTNRMYVKSENSDNLYLTSQRISDGVWQCDCMQGLKANKTGKYCKHIKARTLVEPKPKKAFGLDYPKYTGGKGSPEEWAAAGESKTPELNVEEAIIRKIT